MKRKLLVCGIWLGIWFALNRWIDNQILFAGPLETGAALLRLSWAAEFWESIGHSLLRILGGCLVGGFLGVTLAAAASRFLFLGELLAPLVAVLKAAPVVSFVILILIWAGNRRLSFYVCAVIVFPILYLNAASGIAQTDKKLLEMAEIFRMPRSVRWRRIIWPSLKPYLLSASSVALGTGMKGGVSAEVIGQPLRSIGNSLYRSKIVLATDEVFAWTIVTILLSSLLTNGFQWILERKGYEAEGKKHRETL